MTDEEKMEKLKEEKKKLIDELAQAQEETKRLENEIEKTSFQMNSIDDNKKQ